MSNQEVFNTLSELEQFFFYKNSMEERMLETLEQRRDYTDELLKEMETNY